MAYQVLARKWRPQTFEDLIGQEFAALTLKNSIESGKIAHALIFAGPRGIGKTSTARIVAKAINCEQKDTGEYPCKNNQCTPCQEISEGKSLDVHEIDAASHTGVNDIREIIENVKYMPNAARKKVYIIDEVHMLSQSAFNALLKTLEEPPEHVLFILATTEVHKIPATILSRCQRYDFRKVSVENIKNALSEITSKENVNIDDKTLYLIAKEADGSLRDSLSLLDQLIATFDAEIEYENVINVLGLLDNSSLKNIAESIFNKDPKRCIELINEADNKGISSRRLFSDLTNIFQNLIYLKVCGKDFVSDLSDDEKTELSGLVKTQSLETLDLILNTLIEGSEKVQRSFYPKIVIELTLIKLCTINNLSSITDIIDKLNNISSASPSEVTSSQNSPQENIQTTKPQTETAPEKKEAKYEIKNLKKKTEELSEPEETKPESEYKPSNNGLKISNGDELINLINKNNKFLGMRLENSETIEINEANIKIKFPHADINYEYFKKSENLDNFKNLVSSLLAIENPVIEFEAGSSQNKNGSFDQKKKVHKKDPLIEETIKIFNGKLLKSKAINLNKE